MRGLPVIETMAVLVQAGMGHRAYLHSRDRFERLVEVAVAEEIVDGLKKRRLREREALAAEVGNRVGSIVGSQVSSALQNIAAAFRG